MRDDFGVMNRGEHGAAEQEGDAADHVRRQRPSPREGERP
jgi:hypothetical protein